MLRFIAFVAIVATVNGATIQDLLGEFGSIVLPGSVGSNTLDTSGFTTGGREHFYGVWMKVVNKQRYFKITINSMDIGDNIIQIDTNTDRGSFWIETHTLTGQLSDKVITFRDTRFVRISILKNQGTVDIAYTEGSCTPPSNAEVISCDKDFRRRSKCEFSCKSGYLPDEPNKTSYSAKCRLVGSWSKNSCVSKLDLVNSCLEKKCKYSTSELLATFDQEPSGENKTDLSELTEDDILRGPKELITAARDLIISTDTDVPTDEPPPTPTVEIDEICKLKFCAWNRIIKAYIPQCGDYHNPNNVAMSNLLQAKCLQCRVSDCDELQKSIIFT